MAAEKTEEYLNADEIARQRDAVSRRMANTLSQAKPKKATSARGQKRLRSRSREKNGSPIAQKE
jgi:hypothetical protein